MNVHACVHVAVPLLNMYLILTVSVYMLFHFYNISLVLSVLIINLNKHVLFDLTKLPEIWKENFVSLLQISISFHLWNDLI